MSSGESSALREAIPLKRWRTALMSDELYERVEFLEGLAAGLALSPGKPAPNCPSCRLDAARKAEQVGGDAALREAYRFGRRDEYDGSHSDKHPYDGSHCAEHSSGS